MAQLEKFIKVTQEQYNTLQAGGTVGSHTGINPNFIYLVEGSSDGGTTVTPNPTLSGSETDLTSIAINGTNYKIPTGGSSEGGSGQEIIIADMSWMTSQTTGVIPSQYRDVERLKKALVAVNNGTSDNYTNVFRYAAEDNTYFYSVAFDVKPNQYIEQPLIKINKSNWNFELTSINAIDSEYLKGQIELYGGSQEIITADISWMTSETTGLIPEAYRDTERLKKAIVDVGGMLFRSSDTKNNTLTFKNIDYFYDGSSGEIDYSIVEIDLNNWSFRFISKGVPHIIGNISEDEYNGSNPEMVAAKNPLKTLLISPHEICGVMPYAVVITDTATSGTLTQDQIEILQANNQNYIILNDELFRLNDKHTDTDCLVYAHSGCDATGSFYQKCITITLSTLGWVLEAQESQSKLISGTNIKTVNGESILGSGDLTIEGGGGTNVEANPNVEENVEVLTSVSIDDTNYTIPVGVDVTLENEDTLVVTEGTTGISQVMANPVATPTAVLHTVTINNTVYEIPNVEHVSVGANEIVAGDEVGSLTGSGLTVDQIATKEYVDNKISVVLNEDATVNIIIN